MNLATLPLASRHRALGARFTPFAGYSMPVLYSDIRTEHHAVRHAAGLFDLHHMGRLRISGAGATALLSRALSRNPLSIRGGRARYALILREDGGILDDILVYREDGAWLLIVNASNHPAVLDHLRGLAPGGSADISDISESLGMLAVQGPRSAAIADAILAPAPSAIAPWAFARIPSDFGDIIAARTGYTGEDGFEFLVPVEGLGSFFDRCLEAGAAAGLVPAGLGARDTLRLEAGMPLYGHEIGPDVNPFEAGLAAAVTFDRDFVGRAALERAAAAPARRLAGLIVEGTRIPRQGSGVLADGRPVAAVCSGALSPTLGVQIATALLPADLPSAATLEVETRGRSTPARRVPLPFYSRRGATS